MKTNIKKTLGKRDYKIIGITLFISLLFGWVFFHNSDSKVEPKTEAEAVETTHQHISTSIWTCAMHPQIRMDHPGKCPICGMDLIPLKENNSNESSVSPNEIQMSKDAIKIADIQTMVVRKAYPDKEVYLLGKMKPDERNIAELTTRFGGRIEDLFVNFTGQNVRKGEKLATIYSPALVTAQKELLEALDYKQSNPELYRASRNKLKLWSLTDAQIDAIEKNGHTQSYFDILSPIEGTVTRRNVTLGDYVKEGSSLFQVIDLRKIWVMFEAYETDLPWIRLGDKVNFTVQSLPGTNFSGRISFIDPMIDPKTRIAGVRVEVQNPGLILKPDMFANGVVTSSIAGNKKDLMIPKTAVLWTGKRAVVYVKVPDMDQPVFEYREIVLGPSAGSFYVVSKGLQEGEEIAVNGVFKIDAAAQLAGKSSMMNPEGGKTNTMPGMVMPGDTKSGNNKDTKGMDRPDKKNTNSPVPDTSGKAVKESVSMDFIMQLNTLYDRYITLKNSLVQSDINKTKEAAGKTEEALTKVNGKLLTGELHDEWMGMLNNLNEEISGISKAGTLEEQRTEFSDLSGQIYCAVKTFGLMGKTVYYQFCPMARDQKGAYWLSELNEIKNPYYGQKMITCGETKETLKF